MNRKRKKNPFRIFLVTFLIVLLGGFFFLLAVATFAEEKNIHKNGLNVMAEKKQTDSIWEKIKKETNTLSGEENDNNTTELAGKYADLAGDPNALKEQNTYVRKTATNGETRILFAGDILLDDRYSVMSTLQQNGGNIKNAISSDLLKYMQSADIFMLNNEFPYSDRGTPTQNKQFTFRAKPKYVSYLNDMGVDLVSLANNHAYDYGDKALRDTITTLDKNKTLHVGAGKDYDEASKAISFIANGQRISILSATQIERQDVPDTKEATETTAGVFRCWNPEKLIAKIKETKKTCDFVIVYIHWGTENQTTTDWAQEEQAAKIADAGANLIIGDHPHCLQKIEYVHDVPVIYSLGNFWFNSKTIDTGMVEATITKDGIASLQFIPAIQEKCQTRLLEGSEKQRVINKMSIMSPNVSIDANGFVLKKLDK